jgi:hypothetical protein
VSSPLWPLFAGPVQVDFSPDGQFLSSCNLDGVRLWDASSGRELAFVRMTNLCESAVFQPGGTCLVTYGPDGLLRWPLRAAVPGSDNAWQLGPPRRLDVPTDNQYHRRSTWAPSGKALAAIDDVRKRVVYLTGDDLKPTALLDGHPWAAEVALSPDGRWVAAASFFANEVRVWDAQTSRTVWRHSEGDRLRYATRVAFSPDGSWLVTGGETAYQFWRVGTWEPGLSILRQQPIKMSGALAFRPDGRALAIAGSPEIVQLLDAATGEELATLTPPHAGPVSWLAFSPDGNRLAVARYDSLICLWDLGLVRRRLAGAGLDWEPHSPLPPEQAEPPLVPVMHTVGAEALAGTTAEHCLKVPDALEAEALRLIEYANCNQSIQDMALWDRRRWSNGRQLLLDFTRKGGYAELELPVAATGRYRLAAYFTQNVNLGQIAVSLDGRVLGEPFDGYAGEVRAPQRVEYGEVELTAGNHRLRFTAVGRNPRAIGYDMGIDCIQLQPVR